MSLSVTNLVGTTSFTTLSDYTNGKTVVNYATFAIKANRPWIVQLTCPASFTATGGGASTSMSSGIVGVRLTGGSTFVALNTPNLSYTGTSGNASVSGNTFNIDLFFNPGYSYNGGTYSLTLSYTLSQQ